MSANAGTISMGDGHLVGEIQAGAAGTSTDTDLERALGTATHVTGTNVVTVAHTFTANAARNNADIPQGIRLFGLFRRLAYGGASNMLFGGSDATPLNLTPGGSATVTWTITLDQT